MTIYTLSHGPLKLDVSDQGGVIEGFWRDTTPLLRPGKKSGVATDASCFPLVPFANRVSGNRFVWQGREYQLQPNVEWDFFCLEPMSHAPDDHHRPEGGDLIALAPGESTISEMSLRVALL